MSFVHHMTVQRSESKFTGEFIEVHFKKKRLPRKEKKCSKKKYGDRWKMALNKGWFHEMLDYASLQFCKENNK